MTILKITRNLMAATLSAVILMTAGGCSVIYDDLSECESRLSLEFVYDYNIKFADAFSREVKSVNVWAFDQSGNPVWKTYVSGDTLTRPGFRIDTGLGAGVYDFVSWCGLDSNPGFTLENYEPRSPEDLRVKLNVDLFDCGASISRWDLGPLFHGMLRRVEFTVDPDHTNLQTETISLIKDTQDIRIMLMNLDGTPLGRNDFIARISDPDGVLEWNNEIESGTPVVDYSPWNIRYGEIDQSGGESRDGDPEKASALVFEFSTSRLMEKPGSRLNIKRVSDGKEIINIPLTQYFLLVRGRYGDIPDQEYLDRQDDYSAAFFLDPEGNWYRAAGIYINGWAVVPPQDSDL